MTGAKHSTDGNGRKQEMSPSFGPNPMTLIVREKAFESARQDGPGKALAEPKPGKALDFN